MAAEQSLRLRHVDVSELLSEEKVLQKDPNSPFITIADRPEPYRSQFVAAARLAPVFEKERVRSPLIVNTPRGRGLVWRWWPDSVGIVLMRQVGNEWLLDERVTFLDTKERERVTLDLSQIVLNPPKWS